MIGLQRTALASLVAALALGGCASVDTGEVSGSLLEEASPLAIMPRAEWSVAPEGCEGRLSSSAGFAVADSAPELVVAFDGGGIVLCVDTYSAVESELEVIESHLTETLWLNYIATLEVQPLSATASENQSPLPTDLRDHLRPAMGDPQPQPNDTGLPLPKGDNEDGDPQPQPNGPAGSASGGSMGDAAMDDDCEDVEPNMMEQHLAAAHAREG